MLQLWLGGLIFPRFHTQLMIGGVYAAQRVCVCVCWWRNLPAGTGRWSVSLRSAAAIGLGKPGGGAWFQSVIKDEWRWRRSVQALKRWREQTHM